MKENSLIERDLRVISRTRVPNLPISPASQHRRVVVGGRSLRMNDNQASTEYPFVRRLVPTWSVRLEVELFAKYEWKRSVYYDTRFPVLENGNENGTQNRGCQLFRIDISRWGVLSILFFFHLVLVRAYRDYFGIKWCRCMRYGVNFIHSFIDGGSK